MHSIPRSRGHWFLGNTREMQRDPIGFLRAIAEEHGDVVRSRLLAWSYYSVFHPTGVKHVLQENHSNYDRRVPIYEALRPLLGYGLSTNDGISWQCQRRLLQPAFHGQKIAALQGLVIEETRALFERWDDVARHGEALDASKEMRGLVLRIAGRAFFDIDFGYREGALSRAFLEALGFMRDYIHLPFPPLSVPTLRNLRMKRALSTLDAAVQHIISARRASADDRDDVLSILLRAYYGKNDRQLRDEIVTILLAGHDTTANALAWVWCELGRHPAIEARLLAEIDDILRGGTPTSDDSLPYTRCVIEEILRLYPAPVAIPRRAVAEDTVSGHVIPANALVFVSPCVTQRDPRFWENANDFEPERFLAAHGATIRSGAYFPFGAGPHRCIGGDFATMEMQLVIATMAQRYRWKLLPGQRFDPIARATIHPPRDGIWVTLERR